MTPRRASSRYWSRAAGALPAVVRQLRKTATDSWLPAAVDRMPLGAPRDGPALIEELARAALVAAVAARLLEPSLPAAREHVRAALLRLVPDLPEAVAEIVAGCEPPAGWGSLADAMDSLDAVLGCVEGLLAAQAPDTRRRLGVYTTPRPLARLVMLEVDQALRGDLGLKGGLASESTFEVLDPAVGTGSFLVGLVDVARARTAERSGWLDLVSDWLLPRMVGWELQLPPLLVARLAVAEALVRTGYHLAPTEPLDLSWRNALAGPPDERPLVVVGNPPYATLSSQCHDWLQLLLSDYRLGPGGPLEERSNRNHLQDDYVKFLRLAHHLVAQRGAGVIGFVTSASYLRRPWFRALRWRLQREFEAVRIGELDRAESGALFAARQRTVVTLLVRSDRAVREVRYRQLAAGLLPAGPAVRLRPNADNDYCLAPFEARHSEEWRAAVPLTELFGCWGYGVKTNRDGLSVAFDRAELEARIAEFADPRVTDAELEARYHFSSNYRWTTGVARQVFRASREELSFEPYLYRPFDVRWIAWHPALVHNRRGAAMAALRRGEGAPALLFTRGAAGRGVGEPGFFVTPSMVDCHCLGDTNFAPLPAAHPDPQALLAYVYALCSAPSYRARFAAQLANSIPRLVVPRAEGCWHELARFGRRLVALHLAPESVEASAELLGDDPLVAAGHPRHERERLWLNQGTAVAPVPEEVWGFRVGPYRVAEKWLRDRRGRRLTGPDVQRFLHILAAMEQTLVVMGRIDAAIAGMGGWPAAFTSTRAAPTRPAPLGR